MNGNYQVNRFYAQEKINAQLKAAENHRQARQVRGESVVRLATARAHGRVGRLSGQLAHTLETLGEARVASFQR